MKQGLLPLPWSPPLPPPFLTVSFLRTRRPSFVRIAASAALETSSSSGGDQLTGRERRQLKNERRESRAGSGNWREEVENRLLQKPKKRRGSWTEELNLDRLALLGPQWWVIRVSRVTGHEITERLARSLVRIFPSIEFKVYFPSVREERKLKNGSYSTKLKPLFPGCVFLHCVMNKEIHDFIREYDGVGGFLGSKVGNTKRQINKPKPVSVHEMEKIFHKAKEEQENSDLAFQEEQQEQSTNAYIDSAHNVNPAADTKTKRRSRKVLESRSSLLTGEDYKSLVPGASVRVLSGPFTEFIGRLKALDRKTGKATVGFMLFGKESFVDLEVDQIAAETA